jgi:hypothetical protein
MHDEERTLPRYGNPIDDDVPNTAASGPIQYGLYRSLRKVAQRAICNSYAHFPAPTILRLKTPFSLPLQTRTTQSRGHHSLQPTVQQFPTPPIMDWRCSNQ